jgi:hypothetical protein
MGRTARTRSPATGAISATQSRFLLFSFTTSHNILLSTRI